MERLQLARRRREEAEAAAKEEEEERKRVEEAMKAAAAAAGDADEDDDGIEKLDPREIKKMNPKQVGLRRFSCLRMVLFWIPLHSVFLSLPRFS